MSAIFTEFESSYNNPYVSNSSSLVDIGRRSTTDPVRKVLTQLLPRRLTVDDSAHAKLLIQMRDLDFAESEMPVQQPSTNFLVSSTARFLLGLSGGLFLLIPLITMNFVTSQHMRLLVTSLFVLLFSVFLSLLERVSSLEILAGTTAYTAALLIFVGKSKFGG
jgi:hypothetical protein